MVHQGDLLVEIDPRPYQAALAQAEGAVGEGPGHAAQCEDHSWTGIDPCTSRGVIAETGLRQSGVAGWPVRRERWQATRRTSTAAKVQVAYTRITSPITGRIGLRLVDQGNIVHAADTTGLAVITQLQPIAVDFSIPEDNLPQVIKDMRKGQELPVDAFDRELTTQLATGSLETFDSQIDQTTGTIKLKAVFPNNDYSLFPNQFVNVKLLVDTMRDALLVPAAAVQKNPQRHVCIRGQAGQYRRSAHGDGRRDAGRRDRARFRGDAGRDARDRRIGQAAGGHQGDRPGGSQSDASNPTAASAAPANPTAADPKAAKATAAKATVQRSAQ